MLRDDDHSRYGYTLPITILVPSGGTRSTINELTGMNDVEFRYSERLARANVPYPDKSSHDRLEMPTMYATGAFLEVVTRHSGLVEYGGGDDTFMLYRAEPRTRAGLLTVSEVGKGWMEVQNLQKKDSDGAILQDTGQLTLLRLTLEGHRWFGQSRIKYWRKRELV